MASSASETGLARGEPLEASVARDVRPAHFRQRRSRHLLTEDLPLDSQNQQEHGMICDAAESNSALA
jgi:hypothetical protein